MAADRESTFRIILEGDGASIKGVLAQFRSDVTSTVKEIERTTKSLELFSTIQADVKKASDAFFKAQEAATNFRQEIARIEGAGGKVGKELTASLAAAERAAAQASKEYNRSATQLDKLDASLKKAGVDTANLAAAQAKLADATKLAAAAQLEQQQKAALGFKTLKDIKPELDKLSAAYIAIRDSGKLSFGELSTLQARYQQQVAKLTQEVSGLGNAFSQVRGSIIAFTAAFAGVIAGGISAAENFRAFSTQIAAVGTIAGVSDAKLAELAAGVRTLARNMGVDAVNSAKALYDIIGSGIPVDNAIEVLAEATKAARAGLTDVTTAASVGVAVLNGYKLRVSDLSHVYDILFQTVKDGVVTFPELARNIGTIIPIARAANVPLEELGAAFIVLTRQGIDAPEAATAIARAIQDLAAPAPEAADKMRQLGFEFNGLVGSIEQFAKKDLSLPQIQQLIPDIRASRAVLGLAQNFNLLKESLDSVTNSAGSMQSAYARMAATPQARVDRFNSAIKDLSLSIGEFVTNSTPFIEALTSIANAFGGMGEKAKSTTLSIVALAAAFTAGFFILRQLAVPLNLLAGALASMGTGAVAAAGGFTAVSLAFVGLQAALAGFLGFKLGEILFEWSASVRLFGNLLGIAAAIIANLAGFGLAAFTAAITLNWKALKESHAQFVANNEIIREMSNETLSGGVEKTRQLSEAQRTLGEQLSATGKAAAAAATELDGAVTALLSKLDAQAKAIERTLSTTQAKLTSLIAALNKSVADTTAAAQSAISALAANTAQKLAQLSSVDVDRVIDTVKIQRQAAIDRLAILNTFAADAITAFNASAKSQTEIAKKSGDDLKRVDQELAQAKKVVLESIVAAFRTHVDELLTIEKQHLANVRAIEDERRGINQGVEEKIREIRRQSLDAYDQYSDKIRQIDELTSKARAALVAGDNKLAEEFARKAIELAGTVTTEVKKGEQVVVSAGSAQETAIGKINAAAVILNTSLGQRAQAEKDGAAAAAEGLRVALPLLEKYKTELANVTALAKEGIKLKIDADVDAVRTAVDNLEKELAAKKLTAKLIADVTEANNEIQKVRDDLAKGGIPAELKLKTEQLDLALQKVRDAKPELNVETNLASAKVKALEVSVSKLAELKPQIDAVIKSNAADVQADINKLKQPTESTHTIHVQTVRDNATGGLVGDGPQGFARGGGVFPRMGGWKVPGSGDGDTVPAALQAGSYVIRKPAARYYGDELMSAVSRGVAAVRRFAGGGLLGPPLPNGKFFSGPRDPFAGRDTSSNEFFGDIRGAPGSISGASRDVGEIGPPTLPEDHNKLVRMIMEYVADVGRSAIQDDYHFWGRDLEKMEKLQRAYERRPNDDTLEQLLMIARMIGLNLGITRGTHTGFDVDGRKYREVPGPPEVQFGTLPGLIGLARSYEFYRKGGQAGGSDTVPAMLTPGEFVVNRHAVGNVGTGLLHAINDMKISRDDLAGMFSPPQIRRFKHGGEVEPAPGENRSAWNLAHGVGSASGMVLPAGTAPLSSPTTTINIQASAADIFTHANVRRYFVPVWDDITRRSKPMPKPGSR